MKSSHKNSPLPNVFSGFALALVAVVGFFTVGTMLPKQQSQEAVLGASSPTSNVVRSFNGDKYLCRKTECDKVANGGGALSDDTDEDANNGPKCRSVKDSNQKSVCYWDNPIFTAAQCNVDKSVYRNRGTDRGALNLYFSEDAENNVYYNCRKLISPTPTRIPTPTAVAGCTKGWGQLCGEKTCSYGGKGFCASPYVCVPNGVANGKVLYRCAKKQLIGTGVGDSSTSTYVFPTVKLTNPKPTSTPTPNKNIR